MCLLICLMKFAIPADHYRLHLVIAYRLLVVLKVLYFIILNMLIIMRLDKFLSSFKWPDTLASLDADGIFYENIFDALRYSVLYYFVPKYFFRQSCSSCWYTKELMDKTFEKIITQKKFKTFDVLVTNSIFIFFSCSI